MFYQTIIITFCLGLVIGAPQLITFQDGKIGVNFGGYTAQAGLGGLLTGNAAHGGLSASAGTPWGAQAGAGLGGSIDGNAAGTAFAGAILNDEIGATSIIGGSTGDKQSGLVGAEAHSNKKAVISTVTNGDEPIPSQKNSATGTATVTKHTLISKDYNTVQKIKPPKKYTPQTSTAGIQKQTFKKLNEEILPETQTSGPLPQPSKSISASATATKSVQLSPGLLTSVFNIPIGILASIRDNLHPISVQKDITLTKSVH